MPSLYTTLAAIGTAAALVAFGTPAQAAPNAHASAADRQLKVASFNIQHGADADDVLDLERIAQDIELFNADVIALQEVDNGWGSRSDYVDQAAWLSERLGMNYCYYANLDEDPEEGRVERRQYGTAILSRHRLHDCHNTLLPLQEGGEQRGLGQASLKVRGADVTAYVTHLTHLSPEYRQLQFEAVNDVVKRNGGTAVVAGDLNATPMSNEYREYTTQLKDTWVIGGKGDGFTYEPRDPNRRIDYILVTPDVRINSAEVPQVFSSDHFPVVADLTLPHPSAQNGR